MKKFFFTCLSITTLLGTYGIEASFAQKSTCSCKQCDCTEQITCGCSMKHNTKHMSSKAKKGQHPYVIMMDEMMIKMHHAEQKELRCTDVNFLASMIPHHEGAVIMSQYQLKHGKNPKMNTLAQNIINAQNKEISLMKKLLQEYKTCPKGENVSPEYQKAMAQTMEPMMKDFPTQDINQEKNPDRAFALAMIPHHQAAVDMALVILKYTSNEQVKQLCNSIIKSQREEIALMKAFLANSK